MGQPAPEPSSGRASPSHQKPIRTPHYGVFFTHLRPHNAQSYPKSPSLWHVNSSCNLHQLARHPSRAPAPRSRHPPPTIPPSPARRPHAPVWRSSTPGRPILPNAAGPSPSASHARPIDGSSFSRAGRGWRATWSPRPQGSWHPVPSCRDCLSKGGADGLARASPAARGQEGDTAADPDPASAPHPHARWGGVSCCATLSHRPCPLSPRPPAARLGKAAAPGRGRAPGRQRPNTRGDDKADADTHRAAPPPPPSAASSCPSRPPQRPPKRNLSLPRLGVDEEGPGLRMREGTVHHGATLKAPAGRSELLTRWTQAAFTCP